jgi:uncharacterized membrane protein YphA (DoxX/SURF4 family)
MFLGAAELAGGLGVGFGLLTQLAAIGLILDMLGAILRKFFVWHTRFCAKRHPAGITTHARPDDTKVLTDTIV